MRPPLETAMVLAAGLGTRMESDIPKPLAPLAGRVLIDHVLDALATAGVRRAVVNIHYGADSVAAHLAARRDRAPEITLSDEREQLLDTGGGLMAARSLLKESPFVVCNCDSLWRDGMVGILERLRDGWRGDHMDGLMLLAPLGDVADRERGDFRMDESGRLFRARGEPDSFVYAGVYAASFSLLTDAPSGAFSANLLWDRAMERGRLHGLPVSGWMDAGTAQALRSVRDIMAGDGA